MSIGPGSAALRPRATVPIHQFPWSNPILAEPVIKRPFVLAVDPSHPPAGLAHAVVAIGNFDGIHRGHKAVMERAVAIARAKGVPSALLTFEPHPSDYFGGPGTIFRLTPVAAKARLVERLGLDGMIVLPFDTHLANRLADAFVREILVERLGIDGIVAGYDFHFGKMRGGTPAFLKDAGARYGFAVEIVERIEADAEGPIAAASSTATRGALETGDVERAAKLLGHPYAITGTVQPGQRLGRTLGFPTANIEADPSCRLRHGIYAVRAEVEGVVYDAVASWGRRPTVDNGAPLLETFLFDFAGDLYGKTMDVAFIAWLRGEAKFDSLADLTAQMSRDVDDAKAALARL
jgi:riboflavin kinase/FMN adenylyltransferase